MDSLIVNLFLLSIVCVCLCVLCVLMTPLVALHCSYISFRGIQLINIFTANALPVPSKQ